MSRAVKLFCANAIEFVVVTINLRMLAQDRLIPAVLTDGLMGVLGFFIVKWIAEARTVQERVGYVSGAMVGSALGILTARLL